MEYSTEEVEELITAIRAEVMASMRRYAELAELGPAPSRFSWEALLGAAVREGGYRWLLEKEGKPTDRESPEEIADRVMKRTTSET